MNYNQFSWEIDWKYIVDVNIPVNIYKQQNSQINGKNKMRLGVCIISKVFIQHSKNEACQRKVLD